MKDSRSDCVRVLEYLASHRSEYMNIAITFKPPFTIAVVSIRHPREMSFGGWIVGVGMAECNSTDKFDYREGHAIAEKRAFRFIADNPDSREVVFDVCEAEAQGWEE